MKKWGISSCLSKELLFNCEYLVGTNGLWVEDLDKMLNKLTSNLRDNEEIISYIVYLDFVAINGV